MQQNVLICPLYWGIGHATRMVPLAVMLQKRDYKIYVAAPEPILAIFENPDITKIVYRGPSVWYPRYIPLLLALILQSPLILIRAVIDRFRIERIVNQYEIDLLISDNRFGCRSRRVPSIYITHQVNIASPVNPSRRSRILSAIHRSIINRYDECWIPDLPQPISLAGILSDPSHLSVKYRYTGILSHLGNATPSPPTGFTPGRFYLLILSGPEPMKSRFGKEVISLFKERNENLVIAGSAERVDIDTANSAVLNNITRYGLLGAENLRYLIENCENVICRSGYSTVMDLVALGKSALLVPTPGQSEQTYIADYLTSKKLFYTVSQKKLTLEHIIQFSCNCEKSEESITAKPFSRRAPS